MIATSIIQKVDTDRLQRGVEGLTAGAYSDHPHSADRGRKSAPTWPMATAKPIASHSLRGGHSVAVVTACSVARPANTL